MKSILKFDLEKKDDEYDLNRCLKSLDMILALNDIKESIRQKIKYQNLEVINLEEFQEEFFEILNNYDINIDKLVY